MKKRLKKINFCITTPRRFNHSAKTAKIIVVFKSKDKRKSSPEDCLFSVVVVISSELCRLREAKQAIR